MKSKRRKRRKHVSFLNRFEKWFIEFSFGILILITSIQMMVEGSVYEKSFDETEGVIESEKYTGSYSVTRPGGKYLSVDRYYIYSVTYKVEGKEYYSDKYGNKNNSLTNNDKITVRYRRDNPSELIDYKDTIGGMGFLGFLGGIGFIWFGVRDRKNNKIIRA